MKYTSIIVISFLFFISACETASKKTERPISAKPTSVKKDSCWVTYVLVVNLPGTGERNKYFRKALAYSIDRDELFDYAPEVERYDSAGKYIPSLGRSAIYGIVQPGFSEYDIKTIRGYNQNIDSAKYYFKKSKFSSKSDLGVFMSSICGSSNSPTEPIENACYNYFGLRFLNGHILTQDTLFSKAFSGEDGIYFLPLINDYKEPEKYLSFFYSKNDLPKTKQTAYKSKEFDTYFEAGLNALSRVEAITNFKAAEQVLIDDAVIIPLWYGTRLYCPVLR